MFRPERHRDVGGGLVSQPSHVGAIAFSRSEDPAIGDFSAAKLIRKFGDVADDLSAL